MSDITEIINIIDSNNSITINLPSRKEYLKVKRLNIDTLTKLSEIIESEDNNKLAIDYYKYLISIVKSRCNINLNYYDYLHVLYCLRANENSEYNDINLTKNIKSIIKEKIKFNDKVDFKDGPIEYNVTFELPNIEKMLKILSTCNPTSQDVVYYNIAKFIKSIDINADKKTSSATTIEDIHKVYNVISYKALNTINEQTNNINNELYNLYKVNIEIDTGFLFTI